ncbi:hypothetical protein CFP65_6648 [Kitasatospora sp. MMS16-BH015]|uniref:hypothetical protein n=1 Tax=Kitasatospora sp. MMS16-BH015 TaxID=2018025 RepID=UPI000CA166E8|nr:hypothetical protein [Kitasatospora sp. MMS16-BH015]AUG81295.1 hypothetical protein CFP65_6648 [Kitasatospora sp. MMS16-BH015]
MVAEAALTGPDGETVGGVLVVAEQGYLSWLEVYTWQEEVEVSTATARRQLCP